MSRFPWILCVLGATLLVGGAAHGETPAEVRDRLGAPHARIVNGVLEPNYPSVGALLFGSNPDTAGTWCSGTLIGCKTFLTAGHCVEGYSAADFTVFLPSAGFFSVATIDLHPDYDFPVTDVAVLELGATVNGVSPSPLNTGGTPPSGSAGTIVGYGRSGGNGFDYGLKRRGPVQTLPCPATSFYAGSVCWRFARPLGPPGSNSNTCNGDSGGPLFVDFGSGDVVAGITSGGSSDGCGAPDLSYDADVFQHLAFIQGAGGADIANTSCGTLPQVGSASTSIESASGALDAATPQALHTFEVKPGTTRLRVALTAAENEGSDIDLYLRHGSAPTTSQYDCRDIGPNQYGYCDLSSPASGTWYVRAQRAGGEGSYQATVTTFGRDCGAPANDGLICDDGNACTESDICSSGVCTGTAVLDGSGCDDDSDCTTADACSAGLCGGSAVADGTPCDDDSGCTGPDACQAGVCVGASPAAMCKQPFVGGRAYVQLKDMTPSSGDRLLWQWIRGADTAKAEFGDPTTSTEYSLCVYDESGGVPSRVLEQRLPAGSAWKEVAAGFRYRDPALQQSGIYSVLLRAGGDGAAKIVVRGKAHPLGMPTLPLDQDGKVTVQLVNDSGCWETVHSSSQRNEASHFKARAD